MYNRQDDNLLRVHDQHDVLDPLDLKVTFEVKATFMSTAVEQLTFACSIGYIYIYSLFKLTPPFPLYSFSSRA